MQLCHTRQKRPDLTMLRATRSSLETPLMFWKKKAAVQAPDEGLSVWMDPAEFSQMLAILYTLEPRQCLEWGSGGSTKAVLAACP